MEAPNIKANPKNYPKVREMLARARCPFGKEYPACDVWCVRYIEYLFDDAATGLVNEDVAAIVLEPIQASYGCINLKSMNKQLLSFSPNNTANL